MKKIIILLIPLIITLNSKYINANPNNVQNWLNTEINKIIDEKLSDLIDKKMNNFLENRIPIILDNYFKNKK